MNNINKKVIFENPDELLENDFEDKTYLAEKRELEGDPEDEYEELDILENDVVSFVGNFSLAEYAKKLDIEFIKPAFQRNSVWKPKQKSKLIESFLAAYPVPPVILYKDKETKKYLIIDGYQRISTIKSYYNDEFKLKIQNSNCKNKFYSELDEDIREKLNNSFLNCTIVREIEPKNNQKLFLYNLFERLNTGGKTLNAMETRRALSYGRLIKDLETLNLNADWRAILNKPLLDNRFLDVELLLRLFVFYKKYNINNYELDGYKSMRLFLDEFVSENHDDLLNEFRKVFEESCQLILKELGNNPFKLYGAGPNYMILDSIMSAVLIHNGKITDLKIKVDKILKDKKDYYENKSSTQTKTRVEERLEFAVKGLQ